MRTRRIVTGVVLACIVVAFVVSILQFHPTNLFGLTGDDAIYMSSAKALAEGRGYILPNLPGSPPASKYPIFYPWMLSFVWRMNPSFPANLPLAISISAAFGIGFLMAAFAMFSNLGGLSRTEALALTALCALNPLVNFFGASVLSEMPFAFFSLTAMLLAERVTDRSGRDAGSILCGILAGISTLTRVLGFPIVFGIGVTGIKRRSWRQVRVFGLTAAPFLAGAAWNAILSKKPPSPVSGPAGRRLGWTHAWMFYTDYAGMWKLSVPNAHLFWMMLKNNAGMILRLPADLLLGPTFVRDSMLGRVLVVLIAVATLAGLLRQARTFGFKPIHYCLALYAPVVLLWNYPDVSRFLLPFSPLIMAGAWIEGRRVFKLARLAVAPSNPIQERCLGIAVGLAVAALAAGVLEGAFGGLRSEVMRKSVERGGLLSDKMECYDWLRTHTDPRARLIAYEDATAYLYTGHQTVRPIIFTTDEFYAPRRLEMAGSHFMDVAEAIDAKYWLFTSDDLDGEWTNAKTFEQKDLQQLQRATRVVFQGTRGEVSVSAVDCTENGCAP